MWYIPVPQAEYKQGALKTAAYKIGQPSAPIALWGEGDGQAKDKRSRSLDAHGRNGQRPHLSQMHRAPDLRDELDDAHHHRQNPQYPCKHLGAAGRHEQQCQNQGSSHVNRENRAASFRLCPSLALIFFLLFRRKVHNTENDNQEEAEPLGGHLDKGNDSVQEAPEADVPHAMKRRRVQYQGVYDGGEGGDAAQEHIQRAQARTAL